MTNLELHEVEYLIENLQRQMMINNRELALSTNLNVYCDETEINKRLRKQKTRLKKEAKLENEELTIIIGKLMQQKRHLDLQAELQITNAK